MDYFIAMFGFFAMGMTLIGMIDTVTTFKRYLDVSLKERFQLILIFAIQFTFFMCAFEVILRRMGII